MKHLHILYLTQERNSQNVVEKIKLQKPSDTKVFVDALK